MNVSRACAAAITVLLACIVAVCARAQDSLPDVVLVVIAECAASPLDAPLLAERLRVELTSDGVRETRLCAESDPALTTERPGLAIVHMAHVICAAESATFRVRIDDFVTRKRVERTLELDETPPEARLRALALATGELLRASWAELAIAEASPGTPATTLDGVAMRVRVRALHGTEAAVPETTSAARSASPASAAVIAQQHASDHAAPPRAARTSITASLLVRAFPSAGIAPLGGRLALDLAVTPRIVLSLGAEVATAVSLDDPLGTIDVGLATVGLTLAYAAPLGPDVLLTIGPRAAVGAAWASGQAREPGTIESSGSAPVVLLGAALELDVQLLRGCSARFGFDLAGTALSFDARVASIAVTGISGASIGAWAGLALAP